MAEVKRTYYKSGKLESECFEINGKKNINHIIQMDNYIKCYIDDKKVE